MKFVQPIRDKKKLEAMKKILLAESPRNHLLFILGINTGLRISDILQFKVKDLVNERGKPRDFHAVKEKKTGKWRRFPFGKNVKKAIELYMKTYDVEPEDWVFKSRKGDGPIDRRHAWRILSETAQMVGIDEAIGTHSLRKTFGYHAYKSGVDLSMIQYLLNHSSQRETLRYIGITDEEAEDVVINLNL
jgi:integrase